MSNVMQIKTPLDSLELVVSTLPATDKGKVIPSFSSIAMAMSYFGISYDAFLETPMITRNGVIERFEDADYVKCAIRLEGLGFSRPGLANVKEVARMCMADNKFDSAQVWLNGLKWDGVDRCSDLFSRYFGVDETEYTRATSQYFVTAMAGRVIRPGVKADMVPILVGSQGLGKTTAVKALAPMVDTFTEVDLSAKGDANLSRQLRGKLIGELGELRGLKTKDAESIKAWITRTHEEWTPKFVEFTKVMPRRCVFVGTTNETEFLADQTGNRRWLPMNVVKQCDVEALERDRDQVWAQAAHMFCLYDIMWQDAHRLAPAEHENHIIIEEFMTDSVAEALSNLRFFNADGFGLRDVWLQMYGDDKLPTRQDELRVGNALRTLGYEKRVTRDRVTKKLGKKWFKAEET